MHDHTTKFVATLEMDAPLIKAVATLEVEAVLTCKTVDTLDMMRMAVVEESNGATKLPYGEGKGQVSTSEGGRDTLGRDGDCDKVA